MRVYHNFIFDTRILINVSWCGSGSGFGQMIWIRPDPDSKHCVQYLVGSGPIIPEADLRIRIPISPALIKREPFKYEGTEVFQGSISTSQMWKLSLLY